MGNPIRILGPEYKIDIDGDGGFDTLVIRYGDFPPRSGQNNLQIWKSNPDGCEELIRTQRIDPLQLDADNPFDPHQSIMLKVAAGKLPNPNGFSGDIQSDRQLNDTLYIYPNGAYELTTDKGEKRPQA